MISIVIPVFNEEKNLLVVSRIFDSSRVPVKVVEYLVYHEMLHIAIPTQVVNERRKIHPPEFKKLDRSFPEYDYSYPGCARSFRRGSPVGFDAG